MSMSTLPSNPVDDYGPRLRAVTITFTALSVVVMSVRLFVRANIVRAVGLDDWIMALVALISVTGLGLVLAEIQFGAGRHIGDVAARDYTKGLQLNFASQLTYLCGICFAKLSVGASLLRIASTKLWKNSILGCMAFVFLYSMVGFITILAQCSDIRANWDPSVKARCWSTSQIQRASYANLSLNVLTDLVFALAIPICMLWNVNMSRRTKLSLLIVLGLGCFVSACAVVRITYLHSYGRAGDYLWDTVPLATWSVVELNVGVVAGSLPSLRPLAKRFLGSIYGPGSRARHYYGGDTPSKSRGSRHWAALASASGGGRRASVHSHHAVPRAGAGGRGPPGQCGAAAGRDAPLDDASSQKHLHGHVSSPGSTRKASFELPCYRVEAHVTSGKATRLSDQYPTGITKTTHTTVSYDESTSTTHT